VGLRTDALLAKLWSIKLTTSEPPTNLLASVFNSFTDGFGSTDLQ